MNLPHNNTRIADLFVFSPNLNFHFDQCTEFGELARAEVLYREKFIKPDSLAIALF